MPRGWSNGLAGSIRSSTVAPCCSPIVRGSSIQPCVTPSLDIVPRRSISIRCASMARNSSGQVRQIASTLPVATEHQGRNEEISLASVTAANSVQTWARWRPALASLKRRSSHFTRAPTYRVYLVGFMPGFAYMAGVDDSTRAASPQQPRACACPPVRSRSPAGRPGIYPRETPGGWHLIGRTRLNPFDSSRSRPFLFAPGDRVRFHAIDRAQFEGTS